jgi:hypothetical protein
MADWVVLLTGRDPIADVRGTYSSEKPVPAHRQARGRLRSEPARRGLRAAGFRETRNAEAGRSSSRCWRPMPNVGAKSSVARPARSASAQAMRAVVTSDMGIVISNEAALPMLQAWTING